MTTDEAMQRLADLAIEIERHETRHLASRARA
jgi:hypothetical protein